MAEFQADKAKIEIEEAYFNGVYAFTDYAVSFWALHTEATVLDLEDQMDGVESISECLESFLDMHWIGECQIEIPKTLRKSFAVL